MKIAVIGSGISGLTSSYILSKAHEVHLFEKNDYVGGHTHTHKIYEGTNKINVDSGFIVYNENTYPNFIKLINKLNVKSQPTSMGFSVKSKLKDFEYAGNSLNAIFAQRSNLLKPSFILMLKDIIKFNKMAEVDLDSMDSNLSLEDYLNLKKFNRYFVNNYIIPMGAAIWSTSPKNMLKMPAIFFIRFFKNHGLLKVIDRPQWWVIKNGSKQYVKEIVKPFKNNIYLNCNVEKIVRKNNKVIVDYNGKNDVFDAIVIATHSDQAYKMIYDKSKDEEHLLSSISYQKNTATLHTDTSILPKRKLAWSSWNYLLKNNNDLVSLTYNMNILQNLESEKTYCVTLNNSKDINNDKIIKELTYHHPLYDMNSFYAQKNKDKICGKNNTYFCGAYWGYGFHEDGVNSALDVCKKFNLFL